MKKPPTVTPWQRIVAALAEHKLSLTKHRRQVLKALLEAREPQTIAQLRAKIPGSKPHKVTLYRIIDSLTEAGIAKQVRFRHEGSDRYELSELLQHHHHHLVCESCGKTETITGCEAVLPRLTTKKSFKVLGHQLEYYGVCGRCQGVAA